MSGFDANTVGSAARSFAWYSSSVTRSGNPLSIDLRDLFGGECAGARLSQVLRGVDQREILPRGGLRLDPHPSAHGAQLAMDRFVFCGRKNVGADVDAIARRIDNPHLRYCIGGWRRRSVF